MSADEARYVLAHEAGLDLRQFGLDDVALDRVRHLRQAMGNTTAVRHAEQESVQSKKRPSHSNESLRPPSRAQLFAARDLHQRVVRSSRKAFSNGLNEDAIVKATKSVNNRVKKLARTSRDGQSLMAWALKQNDAQIQASGLQTESERNEHDGYRFIFMGIMTGIRNPRAHEDHWEPDQDVTSVLELLGLASHLHRFLDRCENRQT